MKNHGLKKSQNKEDQDHYKRLIMKNPHLLFFFYQNEKKSARRDEISALYDSKQKTEYQVYIYNTKKRWAAYAKKGGEARARPPDCRYKLRQTS